MNPLGAELLRISGIMPRHEAVWTLPGSFRSQPTAAVGASALAPKSLGLRSVGMLRPDLGRSQRTARNILQLQHRFCSAMRSCQISQTLGLFFGQLREHRDVGLAARAEDTPRRRCRAFGGDLFASERAHAADRNACRGAIRYRPRPVRVHGWSGEMRAPAKSNKMLARRVVGLITGESSIRIAFLGLPPSG